MTTKLSSLADYAINIIRESVPAQKVRMARELDQAWREGSLCVSHPEEERVIPDQPGRPEKPKLLSPRDMPRRRIGSAKGLIALVHALAHIELNAIDMSFDLVARFCDLPMPREFLDGAVKVGLDEALHFELINQRLEDLGASYGDLPAHGGLWGAIQDTRHDLLARLAIVPLVLEARGLDVSPPMIAQVKAAGQEETAKCMDIIYQDEITHVAFGAKWFKYLCEQQGVEPTAKFQSLVRKYYRGYIKSPFNEDARSMAGLTPDFYLPMVSISS